MTYLESIIIVLPFAFAAMSVISIGWVASEWRRFRRDNPPPQAFPPVVPIDTSSLRPRLHKVRDDYAAEAVASGRAATAREDLVAQARRTIGRLAYFKNLEMDEEVKAEAGATRM